MSFILELDFFLTPSVTVESATTTKTYSKKRFFVLVYTYRPTKNKNQAFFYCFYCLVDLILLLYNTVSSGNITKHIARHYPKITIEKALSKNQEAINQQIKQLYYKA